MDAGDGDGELMMLPLPLAKRKVQNRTEAVPSGAPEADPNKGMSVSQPSSHARASVLSHPQPTSQARASTLSRGRTSVPPRPHPGDLLGDEDGTGAQSQSQSYFSASFLLHTANETDEFNGGTQALFNRAFVNMRTRNRKERALPYTIIRHAWDHGGASGLSHLPYEGT